MTDVFVNAGPARPFRAPGMPQGAWALEQVMDELALAIGMDPVELRLKNIPTVSQGRDGSPPYTTTGLRECIEKGAEAFGWKEARRKAEGMREGNRRRGVGMAAALWFVGGGGPPSTAIVKLFADGSVNLNMGAGDIGTGAKTVMALVVSEELGVRPEVVQIENADTGVTQFATPSGGSKTVPTEAPAVRAATLDVKRQLIEMAATDLGEKPENLAYDGDDVVSKIDKTKSIKIKDVTMLRKRGVVVGVGYRGPNPEGKTVNPFAAQFCEVEVDVKTGEVRILRFLGANESGRVMNRLTFDSQVYGGITMGIGLAATEMRVLDRKGTGKLCNRSWHGYKVPTAMDVPADMVSLPIDLPDAEANLVGAKGLGEPVTIPTAPAIANAIHHAVGIRVQGAPVSPASLCPLLSQTKEA
jgi:xanthine dehydrogenase YagR molybdenum-binding subunit